MRLDEGWISQEERMAQIKCKLQNQNFQALFALSGTFKKYHHVFRNKINNERNQITYLISQEERMAQIILKRSEYRFMQIAELEELFFRPALFRGRTSTRVQALFALSGNFLEIKLIMKEIKYLYKNALLYKIVNNYN